VIQIESDALISLLTFALICTLGRHTSTEKAVQYGIHEGRVLD